MAEGSPADIRAGATTLAKYEGEPLTYRFPALKRGHRPGSVIELVSAVGRFHQFIRIVEPVDA
jgi:hypothetical protein